MRFIAIQMRHIEVLRKQERLGTQRQQYFKGRWGFVCGPFLR